MEARLKEGQKKRGRTGALWGGGGGSQAVSLARWRPSSASQKAVDGAPDQGNGSTPAGRAQGRRISQKTKASPAPTFDVRWPHSPFRLPPSGDVQESRSHGRQAKGASGAQKSVIDSALVRASRKFLREHESRASRASRSHVRRSRDVVVDLEKGVGSRTVPARRPARRARRRRRWCRRSCARGWRAANLLAIPRAEETRRRGPQPISRWVMVRVAVGRPISEADDRPRHQVREHRLDNRRSPGCRACAARSPPVDVDRVAHALEGIAS